MIVVTGALFLASSNKCANFERQQQLLKVMISLHQFRIYMALYLKFDLLTLEKPGIPLFNGYANTFLLFFNTDIMSHMFPKQRVMWWFLNFIVALTAMLLKCISFANFKNEIFKFLPFLFLVLTGIMAFYHCDNILRK